MHRVDLIFSRGGKLGFKHNLVSEEDNKGKNPIWGKLGLLKRVISTKFNVFMEKEFRFSGGGDASGVPPPLDPPLRCDGNLFGTHFTHLIYG